MITANEDMMQIRNALDEPSIELNILYRGLIKGVPTMF
jgi:hypothetical protein